MGEETKLEIDIYRYAINIFSNLYEEILFRGLVLALCLKYWNKTIGIVFTSVLFGLSHGIDEKGIFIIVISVIMGWAVVKAKNLWAGWVSHQTSDMIIDTIFP